MLADQGLDLVGVVADGGFCLQGFLRLHQPGDQVLPRLMELGTDIVARLYINTSRASTNKGN